MDNEVTHTVARIHRLIDAATVVVGLADPVGDEQNIDAMIGSKRMKVFLEKWVPGEHNTLTEEHFPEKTFSELIRRSQHSDFNHEVYDPLLNSIAQGVRKIEAECKDEQTLTDHTTQVQEHIKSMLRDAGDIIWTVTIEAGDNSGKYQEEHLHHRVNRRKDVLQVLTYQIVDELNVLGAALERQRQQPVTAAKDERSQAQRIADKNASPSIRPYQL